MKTDVGRRIAEPLEQRSQGNMSALARHVGVSPQAVYQWIAGETSPRGANLVKVAEFFGVSPAYSRFQVRPKFFAFLLKNRLTTSKGEM